MLVNFRGFRRICIALGFLIFLVSPFAQGQETAVPKKPIRSWGLRGRLTYGFTQFEGTDLISQDTAQILTRYHVMGDMDAVWHLTSKFRPFFGFQLSSLSFLPASDLAISPNSLFMWGLRGGADWIVLSKLRLQPSLFWGQQPFIGTATPTTLPFSTRTIPGAELAFDWLMSQRGSWINGLSGHARYLMSSKGAEFDVQSGMGLGVRLYTGLQLASSVLRVGVSYSTTTQNTSLLNQKTTVAGIDFGLEYRFPKPRSEAPDLKKRDESKRNTDAPVVRVMTIQKQGTVPVRITRYDRGKPADPKTVLGTWKWGRYNDVPCLEVEFATGEKASQKLCLSQKTTVYPPNAQGSIQTHWRLNLPFQEPTILVSNPCEKMGVVVESAELRGRFGIVGIHCLPNGEERITTSPGIRIQSDSNDTQQEVLYLIRSKDGADLGRFQIRRP